MRIKSFGRKFGEKAENNKSGTMYSVQGKC